MQNLGGQTKSIMVFSKVAYLKTMSVGPAVVLNLRPPAQYPMLNQQSQPIGRIEVSVSNITKGHRQSCNVFLQIKSFS